ncbi:MAG: ABC transporter permease, partial [Brachymonas denitrificans]
MTASSPSISFWRLGWRTLSRDVRAGELRMLVLAVLLAVAALTAVGFFADRLNNALLRDAAQMLGGDVVVSSDQPTPAAFVERAQALGLSAIQTQTFPTMARATPEKGEAGRLVMLKAVSAGYPLRGTLGVTRAGAMPTSGQAAASGAVRQQ